MVRAAAAAAAAGFAIAPARRLLAFWNGRLPLKYFLSLTILEFKQCTDLLSRVDSPP